MNTINSFSTHHPLGSVLLILVSWMLVASGVAALSVWILDLPLAHDIPQSLGGLGATVLLLVWVWRLGWLKGSWIANPGSWLAWVFSIVVLVYLVTDTSYAFFGQLGFDFSIFFRSPAARTILVRATTVGLIEETLFRGVILFVLAQAWSGSRRGILAALIVQAALFALPHMLHAFNGNAMSIVTANVVGCFVSGMLLGAWALGWRTIWPGVVFHAMSNVVAKAGILTVLGPYHSGLSNYLLSVLFDLSLLIVILGWMLRRTPASSLRVTRQAARLS
jgi:membrane protease YdiL (CAAX protease family)